MAHQTPPTKDPGPGADRDPTSSPSSPIGSGWSVSKVTGAIRSESGPVPFAWQHGCRLLLLEGRPRRWVLAELQFDPTACHYIELRRAHFRWPREAAGALLSRALAAGPAAAESAATELATWLAATVSEPGTQGSGR